MKESIVTNEDGRVRGAGVAAIDRRRFLARASGSVALAGLGVAAAAARARAEGAYAGQKVVFASWGGAYQDAQKVSFCEGFAKDSGATVIQDGPVSYAKLRTMIESGDPAWDVVDITIDFLYAGAKDNLFEKIDTSAINTKRIDTKYVHDYGVGDIVWSYNIGYNSTTFPTGQHPQNWADVFDVKRFPGRRSLRDRVNPMLEIGLLADGVQPKDLYPLDVDRAFKKLDTIKKDAIFWTTNSQSQQLLIDGEAGVGVINNGRIYDAVKKGAKLGIEWNQNMQSVDYLVVPHGCKHKAIAMALINEMTLPQYQAKVAELMALAPTNPEAFKHIDESVVPWLSTSPQNRDKGFIVNEEYWRDHYKDLAEKWEAWKLA